MGIYLLSLAYYLLHNSKYVASSVSNIVKRFENLPKLVISLLEMVPR